MGRSMAICCRFPLATELARPHCLPPRPCGAAAPSSASRSGCAGGGGLPLLRLPRTLPASSAPRLPSSATGFSPPAAAAAAASAAGDGGSAGTTWFPCPTTSAALSVRATSPAAAVEAL